MFLLLYDKDPKDKVLVNLASAKFIEPYEDENERDPNLRIGIIINWGHPDSIEDEDFRVYHGITFEEVCKLIANDSNDSET